MAKGMEKSVSRIQRFQRASESSGFHLEGQPTVVVEGYAQGSEDVQGMLQLVHDGAPSIATLLLCGMAGTAGVAVSP